MKRLHKKDKCLVENQVKLVYRRVYAELRNRIFYSLQELNQAVAEKMQAHNRKRMQQHPYSREEHFLAIEKPALRPLPSTGFEIKSYTSLKVGVNGCIYLGRDKHHYSVPYTYIGQQVKVVYTRTLVKIYALSECIAMHKRSLKEGQYTIVRQHMASHSLAYRDRSPAYYTARAKNIMPELGEVVEFMFATATVPPETFYKGCEGLLHLQRTTDPVLFAKACNAALLHQNYRYAFILRMVESKCHGLDETSSLKEFEEPHPEHANVRGKEQFK